MNASDDDIKSILKIVNELRATQGRIDVRLTTVEDWLRLSVESRENKASVIATMQTQIASIKDDIKGLVKADQEIGNRFWQVWSGIFVSVVVAILVGFITRK